MIMSATFVTSMLHSDFESARTKNRITKIIYIMMLSDMENLLSVWENVLSIAKVTKYGQYCIKERESAIISKIVTNFYIVI